MAKNREPEKPVESESESGEEEDDATSEESDSEPELTQAAKNPSISALKKAEPQSSSKAPSSDEDESGSESESDSDAEAPKVKPLASKPMDEPQKPRSKSISSEVVTPVKSTAGKRPAEEKETDGKDAKKSKNKTEIEGSEKKATLFQRLWSEDDEIEILKGIIDYSSEKKSDPIADLNAFHDFIKKNLHVAVTRTQLQDKIRRLKKKYMNNKSKEKGGKDRTFTNPHEQRTYELSKKVWGNESGRENGGEKVIGSPKANGTSARKPPVKKANVVESEAKDVKSDELVNVEKEAPLAIPAVTMDYYGATAQGRIQMLGVELFETGKGLEGEKSWKKLKMEEMDAHLKLMEVKTAQTKLVVDYLKAQGH